MGLVNLPGIDTRRLKSAPELEPKETHHNKYARANSWLYGVGRVLVALTHGASALLDTGMLLSTAYRSILSRFPHSS